MINSIIKILRKRKNRHFLVLSAGGASSGIQGISLAISPNDFSVNTQAFVPYPESISAVLKHLSNVGTDSLSSEAMQSAHEKMTQLIIECGRMVLAQLPETAKVPDLAILNGFKIKKRAPSELDLGTGDLGNIENIAHAFNFPFAVDVCEPLSRPPSEKFEYDQHLELPLAAGHLFLAEKTSPPFLIFNIGIHARITLISSEKTVLLDTIAGPGMSLINRTAILMGSANGFDRDGACAATGTVHTDAVTELTSQEGSIRSNLSISMNDRIELYVKHPLITALSPADQLATITAVCARIMYDFCNREVPDISSVKQIFVAGGGTKNQTLLSFLDAYFDVMNVSSIETIGIPADAYIPTALGLSVYRWIDARNKKGQLALTCRFIPQ